MNLKNNNVLKIGAAAFLSIGVLSACGDEDPVIEDNDDINVEEPTEVTPDENVDMEPDADIDMDVEMNDEEDGDDKATN